MIRENPEEILRERILEVVHAKPDAQETAEREDAADAYLGENEKHFVDYTADCIKTSVTATEDIRKSQQECYDMYLEREPAYYKNKASWQSRTVIPKPFQTVQFGAAAIKKAFSPNFLTVKDPLNKTSQDFWQAVLDVSLNDQNANLPLTIEDATTMALAVGISMEVIPLFIPGIGLRYDLVEPWKISRDPDAPARDPQGGMYWIHSEWLDYFVLQAGQNAGKYFDVARAKDTDTASSDDPFMTPEAIDERKKHIWTRSDFRKYILTYEFWGTILSPSGEVLLESGTYSVAGQRVIEKPRAVRYQRLRWPGIGFSALPDLLTFGGRGLLESVRSIWEALNQLMCLADDNYKWIINPTTEINVDLLVDPEDVEQWPGKKYLTKDSIHGVQAVRATNRRDPSSSVLANAQYYDQNFQRGALVSDAVQGLPGYRKDVTWRESAQNLNQAMGVFGQMGGNIEYGTSRIIAASQDVIATYAGYADYVRMLGEKAVKKYNLSIGPDSDAPGATSQILQNLPKLTGTFHVSGLTALMKEAETLGHLREIFVPLCHSPRFSPYLDPYRILRAIETRVNLLDEKIVADAETAQAIREAENAKMMKGEHVRDMMTALEKEEALSRIEAVYGKLENQAKEIELSAQKIRNDMKPQGKTNADTG